jgi:hypothetical protein
MKTRKKVHRRKRERKPETGMMGTDLFICLLPAGFAEIIINISALILRNINLHCKYLQFKL